METSLMFIVTLGLFCGNVPCIQSSVKVYVKPGETTILICPQRSGSIPTLWMKDDSPIADGFNVQTKDTYDVLGNFTSGEYNLKIKNVTMNDFGRYTCVPVIHGRPIHIDVYVDIYVAPSRMMIENTINNKVHVVEQMEMLLMCSVHSGQPQERLSWLHDGRIVTSGGPGTLIVRILVSMTDHKTNYTCMANNSADEAPLTKTVTLDVAYKPRVSIHGDTTVIEGLSAVLECNGDSNPPATNVVWWKILDSGQQQMLQNTSALRFHLVTRRDSGIYTCEVLNGIGKGSARVSLDVQFPPDIVIHYLNYSNFVESKELRCLPMGNPQNYTFYKWEHTSEFGEHIRYLTGNDAGILRLESDSDEENWYQDDGYYTCTVGNGVPDKKGVLTKLQTAYLGLQGKPVILAIQKTHYGILERPLELCFDVISEPKFDDIHIENFISTRNHTNATFNATTAVLKTDVYGVFVRVKGFKACIKILNLTKDWLKAIAIGVSNIHGKSEKRLELKQATPPQQPMAVNATTKDNTVIVSWQRNFDGGLEQTFYIEYQIPGDVQWSTIKSVNQSKSEVLTWTITGLRHNQVYTVRMYAQNILGKSNRTDEIKATTEGSLNVTAVIGVTAASVVAVIFVFVFITCIYRSCNVHKKLFNQEAKTSESKNEEVVYHEIPDHLVTSDVRPPKVPKRCNINLLKSTVKYKEENRLSSGYLTPTNSGPTHNKTEGATDIMAVEVLRKLVRHSINRREVLQPRSQGSGANTCHTAGASKEAENFSYISLASDLQNNQQRHEYMSIPKNI